MPLAVRRHPVVAEVAKRLAGRCGVPAGATVVVGVSGGADSLSLLLSAAVLDARDRPSRAATLHPVAAHVNHHLRESADRDARSAAAACERLGLPFHLRDVHPRTSGGSVAASARRLRYEALGDDARSVGASLVAVAHHAEDQLETLLMALGRGAGLSRLSGMAWRRRLAGDVWLVRPMLSVRRSACRDLCTLAGLEWCDDPGNADPRTVRGRLRRDVLPVLEELWPGAAGRATAAAESIAAGRMALDRMLQAVFGDASARRWERAALRDLPEPAIAEGLRRAALDAAPESGDEIGQAHLLPAAEAIADAERSPRRFDWPGGLRVDVTARTVVLTGGPSAPGRPCTGAARPER